MHVPLSDAKGRLTDLVRRAEAGEEIVLTRHGHETVRLTPVAPKGVTPELRAHRRKLLDALRGSGKGEITRAVTDDMYDENGLPV